MTILPVYTLDHVTAALGEDAAAKLRDYVPPPPVSPELRLARELIADAVEFGMTAELKSGLVSDFRKGHLDWGHLIVRAVALQRRHELDTPAQPQADDDGWIPWHGGECPVEGGSRLGVRFRDGGMAFVGRADDWSWKHQLLPGDIIAYKPEPGK